MSEAPPCIYILCGNAAYNRGDRGNLLSQIALLNRHFPDALIVCDSLRPEVDAQWFAAKILKRGFFLTFEQIRWLNRADVVVWGGGALLADNSCRLLIPQWFMIIAFVRLILRKPIMMWAHGVVLQTGLGKSLATCILRWVDVISVRDCNSAAALAALRPSQPIEQTADPAILLAPSDRKTGLRLLEKHGIPHDKPIIAFCPTFWHLYHDHHSIFPYPMGKSLSRTLKRNTAMLQRYKTGLALVIHDLLKTHDAYVVMMPRYPDVPWDDVQHCRDIQKESACPNQVYVWEDDTAVPSDFFALWRCFDMVVSVAMHDAIFAYTVGTPVLHLYYEPKGKDFFEAIQMPELMMPWEKLLDSKSCSEITLRATEILKDHAAIKERMGKQGVSLRERAERNAVLLGQLLEQRRKI